MGPDLWVNHFVDVPIDEDRWVKSVEVKAGDAAIVHHFVVYLLEPEEGRTPNSGASLAQYVPGKDPDIYPSDTGKLLRKGSRLRFDVHYHPSGKASSDISSVAFAFYPKDVTPKYHVRTPVVLSTQEEMDIPANKVTTLDAYFRLSRPTRLVSVSPHMHLRGVGQTLEAIIPTDQSRGNPEGGAARDNLGVVRRQTLYAVRYDFNWQIKYNYADDSQPLLPAGTILHLTSIYDNTPGNRHNPDPRRWVGWGQASNEEMSMAWLDTIFLDDADYERMVAERKAAHATRSQR